MFVQYYDEPCTVGEDGVFCIKLSLLFNNPIQLAAFTHLQ